MRFPGPQNRHQAAPAAVHPQSGVGAPPPPPPAGEGRADGPPRCHACRRPRLLPRLPQRTRHRRPRPIPRCPQSRRCRQSHPHGAADPADPADPDGPVGSSHPHGAPLAPIPAMPPASPLFPLPLLLLPTATATATATPRELGPRLTPVGPTAGPAGRAARSQRRQGCRRRGGRGVRRRPDPGVSHATPHQWRPMNNTH